MLKDKLKNDVKEALKAGDSSKRMLLGMVLNAIKNKEIDKRSKVSKTTGETDAAKLDAAAQLNDEEVTDVLASEIKKRKESIESFIGGGRPELAEGEKAEITTLMTYMPEQMTEDAVRAEVKKAVAETGASSAKDMGKVIAAVMAKVKGKTEGTLVSRLVKEELS